MRYQAALRPDCSTNTAEKTKFKGYISYKFIKYLIFNAIRDHMIIECPNCNKKFNLDEKLIPENGRTLKCSSCDHVWHYIISLNNKTEDPKIVEVQNTEIDDTISKIDKEVEENKETIKDEDTLDSIDISDQETTDKDSEDKDEKIDEENEREEITDKKKINIKIIFVYIIILITSLLGIILLLDTFKMNVSNIFPGIIPIFDSLYETILDFKLFFIDLTN